MEYNKYGESEQDAVSQWNSAPCGFKGATWIVWGAFFLIILSVVLRVNAVFSVVDAMKHNPYMSVSGLVAGSTTSGAATALTILASAFICVLFFLFAQGTKAVDANVSRSSMIIAVMNVINLVLSLFMTVTATPASYQTNLIVGLLSLVFAIVMWIYFNIIGNQLMAYEGRAEELGRSFKMLFKFILAGVLAGVLGLIFVAVGAKSLSEGITTFGSILLILTLLWCLVIFFYSYFGVYLKMGQMLDAND